LQIVKYAAAWLRSLGCPVTKLDLARLEHKTMSLISEFAAKQTEHNGKIDAAIDDLQGDVNYLKEQIVALQTDPADAEALANLDARATAVVEKLEALASQTPPKPPPG
jgi:tRNA U34 5-methylaminomethyl-2-thiouridine-forming methyltransferase MnmC